VSQCKIIYLQPGLATKYQSLMYMFWEKNNVVFHLNLRLHNRS